MPFESSITKSILGYLNSLPDCIAEKTMGNSVSSGRADINGCIRGHSFRIEVKTPDNKNETSTKQEINLRKWYNSGATVVVTYSLEFIKQVIPNKILNPEWVGATHFEKNGCESYADRKITTCIRF